MGTKFLDEKVSQRFNRQASEALVANRLVKINATDHEQVDQCDTANDVACGVAEYDYASGNEASIKCGGHLQIEAGGAISPGDELVSDADGKVVPRGTTATTLYNVVGRALSAAADTELVMVDWNPYSVWGANAS